MPYVDSNDAKIYYEITGSGTPLVLIMGLGADLTAWKPHSQVFERHFKCVSIDNRGAGKSQAGEQKSYTTALMAQDVIAVMDHAGIYGAQIAGISMGGAIAQVLALTWPERVLSLLLINTFAALSAYSKRIFQLFKEQYGKGSVLGFDQMVQLFIYAPDTFSNNPGLIDEREGALRETQHFSMEPDAYAAQCDALINHYELGSLAQIHVPTLVVGGKADILTPPQNARQLAEGIPGAALTFTDGGHVQHFEHLDEFNTLALDFLLKHAAKEAV